MTSEPEMLRCLLVGKTGGGKSTSGNIILGAELFSTGFSFGAVTANCELRHRKHLGRDLEITDSPGLFDPKRSNEEICTDIARTVSAMHPGPHAILYVIQLGRYTEEEFNVYTRLKELFDENFTRYLVVLFTGGDKLKSGDTIQKMMEQAPEELRKLLEECDHRYIVFNNMATDTKPQVKELFSLITKMNLTNKGQPYKCPNYTAIGQNLEAEVTRRLAEVEEREVERTAYMQELKRQTEEAKEAFVRERQRFLHQEAEHEQKMKRQEREMQKKVQQMTRAMEELQMTLQQRQEEERHLRETLEKEKLRFRKKMKEQQRQNREELERQEREWQNKMEALRMKEDERQKETERRHQEVLRKVKKEVTSSSVRSALLGGAITIVGNVLFSSFPIAYAGEMLAAMTLR